MGELALREGQGATFTLDREKHLHPNHDVLIVTAARLLGSNPGASLVVGLPVAYFRRQKDDMIRHLESVHVKVGVDGGSEGRVSFANVVAYPQGVGALLMAPELPAAGLVLMIDVGYKTTDFVTAEVSKGSVRPVGALCGSVETALYDVDAVLAGAYQDLTGMPLTPLRLREGDVSMGKLFFYGKEIDLSETLERARKDVALRIKDQVTAQLGDRAAFVRRVYLAGGGAYALPHLSTIFPLARILPDAQWANALGFLRTVIQS